MIRNGDEAYDPTICYAFMQAVGMVNDHVTMRFRRVECQGLRAVHGSDSDSDSDSDLDPAVALVASQRCGELHHETH